MHAESDARLPLLETTQEVGIRTTQATVVFCKLSRLRLTCASLFSTSTYVSVSPANWVAPMRGSVTDGSV